MSIPVPRRRYTFREYLASESVAVVKHEFVNGEIHAMAGGTLAHSELAGRVLAAFIAALKGRPCHVFTSDARVRVVETGLDTYPDVSVACGEARRDAVDTHALVNPLVLVEVTSDSTESWDRDGKLRHCKRIASLREYVIVSHRERLIEVWRREGDRWERFEARSGAVADVPSIECALDVDATYEGVVDAPAAR
jgi:Uma2 family endonuclease